MSFSISIYQRKRDGQLEWTTLGLGPDNVTRVGQSPTKLQRHIADELRQRIRKMRPAEASRLELVRGRKLVRVRMEISLAAPGKRERASGVFPLVVEPRWVGSEQRITIAYHPLRQDDWLVLDDDAVLEDEARRFFGRAWGPLGREHVERELVSDGKDGLTMLSFVERLPSLVDELPPEQRDVWADLELDEERKKGRAQSYGRKELRQIGVNVTTRAADGILRTGRPREPWRSQLLTLLGGPKRTPVVLIGPPGVGKTTLLHRFASDLLEADDYPSHRNLDKVHELWRISSRRILAGMSHLGDWEQRCTSLASEARDPRVILWAEDLAAFGRAGRSRDSDRTLSDVFRGPMARGELAMVGEATRSAWSRLEEDAPAFADLFTVLEVLPTTASETFALLLHEARQLEVQRRLSFEPDAFQSIVQLGEALAPGSAQPGIAVDLLHRLAAEAPAGDERASIGQREVVQHLSKRTGLPEVLLRPSSELSDEELERSFGGHVMGQPDAVRAAVDLVARIRAGLTDPHRPYATYLFTGPTGTGKTQMAKAIAGFLYGDEARLVRFDMGEMSGPDAIARLIGDRYQPRGLLTEAIRQQPFSVLLLDEIEKAHPSVLYLLLSLLDEGRLTDAAGDEADFTRTVIVMTSNLGARARAAIGFGERADAILRDVDRAVREFFPPELFNRIDRVVPFRPLTPEIAERVTEKELAGLLARRGLTDRHVFVFAHEEAVRRMSEAAFDERGGARSVQRWLESNVGTLLANELAGGSTAAMRIARVYGGGERPYRLHVEALAEAAPDPAGFWLLEWMPLPVSELRGRVRELHARASALLEGDAAAAIAERASELLSKKDPAAQRTLYFADAFRAELSELVERLASQRGIAAAPPVAVTPPEQTAITRDGAALRSHMRRSWKSPRKPAGTSRRRSGPGVRAFDREELLGAAAQLALLERAVTTLEHDEEHRVVLEIARVGRGRQPPKYEKAAPGFFEKLALLYAGARGEVIAAASRDESGAVREGELAALLEARPVAVVLEIEGVAVRSFFSGEEGSHVWTSVGSGSEIVRVKLLHAERARAAAAQHREEASRFDAALSRGDDPLPANPEALLPVVRRIAFDPPSRLGEPAPLELEDYATSYVELGHATDLLDAVRAAMRVRASRTIA
jgi:ATP-dependent Clp protease ATP-binding subunit ClpC